MKDFRVPLEDQATARLAELEELKFTAASSRAGLSKPTAYPAATVTYIGFRRIAEDVQFGGAQHTLIKAELVVTLATRTGQPAGSVLRGPDKSPALLHAIFAKLSGFLIDLQDPDLETPWPLVIEDESAYEVSGEIVSWQQLWSLQINLAGFAP